MAPENIEGRSPVFTFPGIKLDCSGNEARLLHEKVEQGLLAIHSLHGKKKVTLKELQSLIGLLNFACSVVTPGRVFLRRLINLTIGIKHSHYFIRLTSQAKNDLRLWDTFMSSFNGKSFFHEDDWATSYSLRFYTDSAKSSAYGLIFGKQWVYGTWPASWKDHHISFLEFFPIVLGLGLWCSQNKRVVFITDNESLINKGESIDTIKLTLRHYKRSNPAEPVNIFIYQAQPVCPVTLLLAYLNLRGTSPGPLFCWPDISISRIVFPRACLMPRLGPLVDGDLMHFYGTFVHLL